MSHSQEKPAWEEIEDLFFQAMECPLGQRTSFLRAATDDSELIAEVAAMLESNDQPGLSIERLLPAAEPPPTGPAPEGSLDPPSPEALSGQRVGPYLLGAILGRGGMGEVYLAERDDQQFRRQVAIKLMGSDGVHTSSDLLQRFELERRVLAQLQHPGIAQLHDAGALEDGRPYLVMEYVPGETITDYCDSQRLGIAARLELFLSVCQVVQFAHSRLVIHRDLKPGNILVMEDEEGEGVVKLLDFGIAKLLESEHIDITTFDTRTSARPMTPLFAAPEQFAGETLTTATDVYSLGVLLYLLLTGSPPYESAGSAADYERQVRSGTPPRLTEVLIRERVPNPATLRGMTPERLQKRLQGDLERIAAMALHVDVQRRYSSAGQLGEDIARCLRGEAVVAQDDTWLYRLKVFVRRNRGAVASALAFGVSLLILSVFLAVQTKNARSALARAEQESERSAGVVEVLVDLFATADPRAGPVGDQIPVSEFLARVDGAVESLGDDPELQLKLLDTLGQIRFRRGEGKEALARLERAAQTHRAITGNTKAEAQEQLRLDHAVAKATATVESERGIELLRRSLDAHTEEYGHDTAPTAIATLDLANTLEPSIGLPMIDQALSRLVAELGRGHVDIARALNMRARVRAWVGMVDGARRDSEEAVAIFEKALGSDHSETLQALHTFSRIIPRSESVVILGDLIERQKRVFGAESAPVATSLNTLGEHLARLGEISKATQALRGSLDIRRRLFGEDSPTLGNPGRNLAMLTGLLGQYQEAADLFETIEGAIAAEGRSRTYIEIQSAFIDGRLGPARALDEAIQRIEERVATLDQIRVGDQDRYPCRARIMLAKLLLAAERSTQALEVAQMAHDDATKILRPGHTIEIEAALILARAKFAEASPGAEIELREKLEAFEGMPLHERIEVRLARRQLERAE